MNHSIELLSRDRKQVKRLDKFQAFVHERRRIDSDLRPHIPVWVVKRLFRRYCGERFFCCSAERSARCRKNNFLNLCFLRAWKGYRDAQCAWLQVPPLRTHAPADEPLWREGAEAAAARADCDADAGRSEGADEGQAGASMLAPFDYSSMIFAMLIGWVVFSEVPTLTILIGAALVIAGGVLIIWRERQLGVDRSKSKPSLAPAGSPN